jgi:hypothetical protein
MPIMLLAYRRLASSPLHRRHDAVAVAAETIAALSAGAISMADVVALKRANIDSKKDGLHKKVIILPH